MNPDNRKLYGTCEDTGTAHGRYGRGNETDAWNGKAEYPCILCDFWIGRICRPRCLRAKAFCKMGRICKETQHGN